MSVLETDTWYWLPDEKCYMIPAKLLSYGGGSAKFEVEDGLELIQRLQMDVKMDMLDPQCLDANISNLIELNLLTEKAVLHLLRIRFMKDDIYTLVSGILIACNPFKAMNIYDEETMDTYRRTRDHSTLPPHIFSLANEAYTSMMQTGSPQSVVISGESGAGKTESIKLILKYLARLSEIASDSSKSVKDQILCANPLLEAFGNAKTSRNNNSSRFGKLITVNFSGGVINQASIISYLLEKSRVVHQQLGERNYHVFYQFVAACATDVKLGVENGVQLSFDEYSYLSDPNSTYLRDIDEAESFSEVEKSMEVLGMTRRERTQVFQVVACVLRLGNIEFNTADTLDQRALIENVPELGRICDMLGLKQSEMKRCLVSRNFGVRSIVTCFFSVQQAKETRDAFSKALYSYLFNWLIKMINRTLATGNRNGTATNQFIALLDIFGFENFETNSYEQLLINYCNEKLQFHFNSHIFVMEQEAYVLQGIDIGYVNFKDNSPTLSAIETKVTGLLAMIDEEINIPKGSDMSLLNKILSTHDKSGCVGRAKPYSKSKTGQRSREHLPKAISIFAIHHYAGDVSYDVNGFLEKNKDALSTDLMYIGKNSTVPFIAELFKDYEASIAKKPDTATTVKKDFSKRSTAQPKGQTIATQFKKQLADLINTLNSTDLYFVRCMKTNNERVGGVFDCELMLRQLQYSGLLEVCRIRQEGYPLRYDFQGFFCMYRKLNPSSTSGPLLVRDLEEKGLFGPEDYCIGKSMIFLKYDAGKKLEQLRGESINDAAIACQSWAKVFLAKRRLQHFLSACRAVQSSVAGQDKSALELIIDIGSRHLPESGSHVPAVAKAKIALKRLVEEEPVINALSIALQRKDFSAMEEAIGQARSLKPEFSHPLVSSCEDAVKAYLKGRMREVKGSFRELAISDRKSSSPPPRNSKASLPLNKSSISSETKKNSFNSKQNVRGNTESLNNQASENVYTAATNSLWGSPSAIRAAKGEISPPRKASATTHSSPVLKMKPKVEKSSPLPLPPPESNGNTVIANGNGDESDEIVGPSEDFKTKKRSILIRRMSAEQIGVAAEVHHMIEVLTNQSMSETGLHPNAIRPLEVLLKKISVRDDSVSREVTEMMMAEQELIRAKKQLLLQTAVDKVRPNTPLWKLKNLSHQARQIGMENYDGCRNLDMYINNR